MKNINVIVAGIGTSGTIIGIAKRIKEKSPKTKIAGVLPPKGYQIQGIQNQQRDFSGRIYHEKLIDIHVKVSKKETFRMAKKVARKEGLLVGMSSGAALFVVDRLAKQMKSGNIVVILPDRGEKYLSTELFK